MGGQVVKGKWWSAVQRTEGQGAPEPVVVQQVSLDVLAEQVRVAGNRVLQAKAVYDSEVENYRACQRAMVDRMKDVALINGVKLIQVAQDNCTRLEDQE